MGRKSVRATRIIGRFFKERQIYHRSDGVVHFISMSTRTQIALAAVVGSALLWIAYASVNVVFKEQIIVAKDRNERVQRDLYERKLEKAHRAFNDMNALNSILQEQFDAAMGEINHRHLMLQSVVEQKSAIDSAVNNLAEELSDAGFPNGQKPRNGNRIMIDLMPSDPTPRRSRITALQRNARLPNTNSSGLTLPRDSSAANSVAQINAAAGALYEEQILLLATLEETASERIAELHGVLATAGITPEMVTTAPKIANDVLAQGGPFIDAMSTNPASAHFFHHTNKTGLLISELDQLTAAIDSIPFSTPVIEARRQTSGFGVRRDPINGRAANHYGLDFAARWAAPIVATAPGKIRFAGYRAGFGRTVEIDHGNGFVTRYAHMNKIVVKKGATVKLHQKVGELGNSGRSTGPHVHYEILYRGQPKNPRKFIEAGRYVFES